MVETLVGATVLVLLIVLMYLIDTTNFSSYIKGRDNFMFIKSSTFSNGEISVHLIGLNHGSRYDFYQKINTFLDTIPEQESITLVEGIADSTGIIEAMLLDKWHPRRAPGTKLNRGSVPVKQGYYLDFHPRQIPGDLDVKDLNETHREWYKMFLEGSHTMLDPELCMDILIDLHHIRNARLVEILKECIDKGEYKHIIIPWGALHMNFFDKWLRNNGFKVIESKYLRSA